MSYQTFKYVEELTVKEVWFETPSGYKISLKDLRSYEHDGSAIVLFPHRLMFPYRVNQVFSQI
jgi:hypothetical protein